MKELSLMEELKETIIDEEAKVLGLDNIDESYRILDDEQANFFLRRLEEIQTEEDGINEMCDNEIDKFAQKVNNFRETKINSLSSTKAYYKKLLEKYAEVKLTNSNKKSVKLPFGTLQFRKSSAQYDYKEEELLKFLKENKMDSLINVKEVPNKADLKKVATIKDGKLYVNDIEITGVTVQEGGTSFDVKLNH
jgi:hypothetical protein